MRSLSSPRILILLTSVARRLPRGPARARPAPPPRALRPRRRRGAAVGGRAGRAPPRRGRRTSPPARPPPAPACRRRPAPSPRGRGGGAPPPGKRPPSPPPCSPPRPPPRRPAQRPRRHDRAVGQRPPVGLDRLDPRARPHLDAARVQLAPREPGQPLRDLAHDPVLGLDQEPARAVEAAARVAVDHV